MSSANDPQAMRDALAAYVRSLMQAYADAAALLPPADRARLPLLATPQLTIAVVGTRHLHVLGTAEVLPAPAGPEISLDEAIDALGWQLRFYDPVIIPGIGLIDETVEPQPALVRSTLGVRTHLFHLVISPGSGLTAHHAQHAGTGLAHAHATAARDFETLAALLPTQEALIQEMQGAAVAGLPRAHALLAARIRPGLALDDVDPASFDAVRGRLLAEVRGART